MRQNAVIDWSNYRMLLFIFLYAYAAYKILQQNATTYIVSVCSATETANLFCNNMHQKKSAIFCSIRL